MLFFKLLTMQCLAGAAYSTLGSKLTYVCTNGTTAITITDIISNI